MRPSVALQVLNRFTKLTDPKMISRVLVFFATFYEQRFLLREGAQKSPKLAVYSD
jgi:hypothetical protein